MRVKFCRPESWDFLGLWSMGLDVPKTNLVVINSSPSTAWEFSQEVNFVPMGKIYWKARNLQDADELEEMLDSKAADIRYEIEELRDLGQIPKITFLRHNSEALPIPSAKEIEELLTRQKDNSESLDSEEESENEQSVVDEDDKEVGAASKVVKNTTISVNDSESESET